MKSRLVKFISNPIIILVTIICTTTGYSIKDLTLNKNVGMSILQVLSNINWLFTIGLIGIIGWIYATIEVKIKKSEGAMQSKIDSLRADTGNILKNHQEYFDHFQKDYFIGLFSLEYKVTCKQPQSIPGEIKYVASRMHAIATSVTSIELKNAIAAHYSISVVALENIML